MDQHFIGRFFCTSGYGLRDSGIPRLPARGTSHSQAHSTETTKVTALDPILTSSFLVSAWITG